MMQFLLTPPLVSINDLSYSLIQIGEMEMPESLVINMSGWSALELVTHWRSEIGELVAGNRDRCCIVSGLTRNNKNKIVPSEWWLIFLSQDKAKFQYQVLLSQGVDLFHQLQEPDKWWKKIDDEYFSNSYNNQISEWSTPKKGLVEWCAQIDVLINAIKLTEIED